MGVRLCGTLIRTDVQTLFSVDPVWISVVFTLTDLFRVAGVGDSLGDTHMADGDVCECECVSCVL